MSRHREKQPVEPAVEQQEPEGVLVAIPKEVQMAGVWAVCQAEPLVALLLRNPEGTDWDVLTSLLVRLQQLVGVMGSALQWERGDADDLAKLERVVHGVARDVP